VIPYGTCVAFGVANGDLAKCYIRVTLLYFTLPKPSRLSASSGWLSAGYFSVTAAPLHMAHCEKMTQSIKPEAHNVSQCRQNNSVTHQCYGSCTGCQSVSALCSRSRGSYISRLVVWLPRTSQTTVAFCRTLVVAHCGPIPMTFGSCLFHEHITNSVIGVTQPPVLDYGTTFHLDSGGRDLPSTLSDNL